MPVVHWHATIAHVLADAGLPLDDEDNGSFEVAADGEHWRRDGQRCHDGRREAARPSHNDRSQCTGAHDRIVDTPGSRPLAREKRIRQIVQSPCGVTVSYTIGSLERLPPVITSRSGAPAANRRWCTGAYGRSTPRSNCPGASDLARCSLFCSPPRCGLGPPRRGGDDRGSRTHTGVQAQSVVSAYRRRATSRSASAAPTQREHKEALAQKSETPAAASQAWRATRESRSHAGGDTDGARYDPAISGDGRYVVFVSEASNLTRDSGRHVGQVYSHDIVNDVTELVSRNPSGRRANGPSVPPAVSHDGTPVAFQSLASFCSVSTAVTPPNATSISSGACSCTIYAPDVLSGELAMLVTRNGWSAAERLRLTEAAACSRSDRDIRSTAAPTATTKICSSGSRGPEGSPCGTVLTD